MIPACRLLIFSMVLLSIPQGQMSAQKAASADDHVARGDELTAQQNFPSALLEYEKALELNPRHYAATWRMSRTYARLGDMQDETAQKLERFRKAEEFARRAVDINPKGSKGFLQIAMALGRVGQHVGAKEALQLAKESKQAVDRAIELNPSDDVAWQILGQWHRRLGTLGTFEREFANTFLGGVPAEASADKAIECFQKAIELNPRFAGHYVELAQTYAKLDRREEAIQTYQKVLTLPADSPSARRFRETALASLEKMGAR
jgi:tetratricopeptide (TPR) repeat protein